jgi:aryl-alcohol dehydrogenase-like predicted oxidoreductase
MTDHDQGGQRALRDKVSPLVLGTMTFGSQTDEATAAEMIAVSADAGITMIDTANVYNGGAAEEILGRVLGRHRDEMLLATKVGIRSSDAGDAAPLSATAIRMCVSASLRRLRTEHIDVLYLHQPDRSTPVEETLAALGELVRAGTVGHVGVSNYAAWQIAELRAIASASGLPVAEISQPLYNLLARRVEQEYAEYVISSGMLNIVYNPLGGGLLTGKHRRDSVDSGGRFGSDNPLGQMYRQRYWSARIFDAVDTLHTASRDHGLSLVETAFRWLLSRESVTSVLIGASQLDHLRANIRAAEGGPLPAQLSEACDQVWRDLDGPAPAYNR